jgi:membrane protein
MQRAAPMLAAARRSPALRWARAPWHGVLLLWAAASRFSGAKGASHGAAVAFYAAFSIAPLLVVVTGVMVWLLGDESARSTLFDTLNRLIGERETRLLADLLAQAPASKAAALSWLALGTTLIGSAGVFVELRGALQAMLDEPPPAFSWWALVRVRLLAVGVVLGSGFLLAVAMVLQTASLVALQWAVGQWPLLAPMLSAVESLWSWAVITVLFALMMRWLPDGRLPKRAALIGAAVAATMFMFGRHLISLYVAHAATQSALGAASSFAALLAWVFWSSQIFLLGAALAVELGKRHPAPAAAAVEPANAAVA